MKFKGYIFKALVLLSTLYAMARMWHWTIGFTYFTQLSNLFAAAVVAAQLACAARGRPAPRWLMALKFDATVSICVTFITYLTLLAPMMPGGMLAAYRQDHYASLFLHIVTPVCMVTDFFACDAGYLWTRSNVAHAMLPPIAYLGLILLLGRMGVTWSHWRMAAPYLFLNYAAPAGWLGFMPQTAGYTTLGIGVFYVIVALVLLFVAIGALLRFAAGKAARQSR